MKHTKRWDHKMLFAIQKIQHPFLDRFMLFCTQIGNGGIIWILFSIIYILCGKKKEGVLVLATLGVCAFIVNLLIKPIFTRKRPFETFHHIQVRIKPPFGTSFPSGHTATSFASTTAILLLGLPFGWLACILAVCIAVSRIYLFVHYPSDVIGGAVIGILIAIVVVALVNNYMFS